MPSLVHSARSPYRPSPAHFRQPRSITAIPLANGLYKITFPGPASRQPDYGVLDLRDGRARGGDAGRAYVGTYSQAGGRFTAELSLTQHRHAPGVETANTHAA